MLPEPIEYTKIAYPGDRKAGNRVASIMKVLKTRKARHRVYRDEPSKKVEGSVCGSRTQLFDLLLDRQLLLLELGQGDAVHTRAARLGFDLL